jgi:hypothetical protein
MRQFGHGVLCVVLAVSALAAGLTLWPGLARSVGLDFWDVPAVLNSLQQEAQREEQLMEGIDAAQRCTAAKNKVAEDVATGRLTLLEGAARFRDLNWLNPGFNWERFRQTSPGVSDDERCCRQVLAYVAVVLRDRPNRGAAVRGRLEAELKGRLERGKLRLPRHAAPAPAGV